MTDTRKPIYRVIINMDADGGMWITDEHSESVSHDIEVSQITAWKMMRDLGGLYSKHFKNNEYDLNLRSVVNVLHGIFFKANTRARAQQQGDGEDTDGTDEN